MLCDRATMVARYLLALQCIHHMRQVDYRNFVMIPFVTTVLACLCSRVVFVLRMMMMRALVSESARTHEAIESRNITK